ncbi:MAG TPA: thioredoxin family protein, partial [Tepidisphaeraceae bacterium]|nr:thioredoxin family protein [Tepidisphaeraceae bacterium]
GALTAILSTPCTAPLFPEVLYASLRVPKAEGMFLVVMVGVGMASPYLLLSAFPELARRFPRTGPAGELVKQMMGFLLIGTAAFFAGLEMVGQPNQWWICFAVVVWACLYLVIRTAQIARAAGALCVVTGLAVALTGFSLVLTLRLTDALVGRGAGTGMSVDWIPYSTATFDQYRDENRIVLVDFTADWCLNCKFVEASVYHDPRAIEAIRQYRIVTIRADLTNHDEPGYQLYDRLNIDGIPYTAIYFPGQANPVGLASIYTTDKLLDVIDQNTRGPLAMGLTNRLSP